MVDRIKALCRQKGTSVTKLEAALGFGNGTIGKWRNAKNAPPADKLQLVADALDVSVAHLLSGEDDKKLPEDTKINEEPAGYDDLNEVNKTIVDTLIEQLLASQSEQ